jgi:hypothetical protein
MTHPAPTPRMGREFDEFLFATIGDDRHGQPLSVLSALARSNVDPWQEAASLSRISRNAATTRLTALIAALPDASIAELAVDPIARDLIARLPERESFAPRSHEPSSAEHENVRAALGFGGLVLLTALALLISAPQSPGSRQSAGSFASTASVAMRPVPPIAHD